MLRSVARRDQMTTGEVIRMVRDASALGERIRQLRELSGLEQAELADKARCSRAYISRLETGGVTNPKLYDLDAVARALGTTVTDLTGDTIREDDAATLRRVLGVKLGTHAAEQIDEVVERLAEHSEQDRRTLLDVVKTLTERFPRSNAS